MRPFYDPTEEFKRLLADAIAPELEGWNGDDIGSWLEVNRSRVAELRAKKVERFALHTLIRVAARLNYRVELKITKIHRPYAKQQRPSTSEG